MIPAQSIRFSLLAPLIGFLAFPTDAWADTDCTSDIADRLSVSAYSALLDGQPGVAGQPQLSASAGLNRESFTFNAEYGFTPAARKFDCDMLLSVELPTVTVTNQSFDVQDVVGFSWEQRWHADDGNLPTLSTFAEIEVPFAKAAGPVQAILVGVLAKPFLGGTVYLNATLQSQNGIFEGGWQAGGLIGIKHDLTSRSALVFDLGIQPSGARIAELALQHDIGGKLSISPGISWTNWRGDGVLTFGLNLQRSFGSEGSQ